MTGISGDVTRQAEIADWSRPTISDPAQEVQVAVEDALDGGPTRAELIEGNRHLRQEDAQLWDWLAQTIDFPPSKQRESSVTATAMGLSLNQVLVLLALILGEQACPGRSTPHRGIKAATPAAGRVLKSFDARCRAWVPVGCLDEISFHGRPVLVGVAPASMTWSLGQKAHDRSGTTWAKAVHDGTALEFVTADAGTGLQAGIAMVPHQRREQEQAPSENGPDVFHTTREARRVFRLRWTHGERSWEKAEAASRGVEPAQRQGQDARGAAVAARWAWKEAEAASQQDERSEAGGEIAQGALAVFRPDGRLNDRARAVHPIALALPVSSGRAWSKVRGSLQVEETLTSLYRRHRELQGAEPEDQMRAELVRLWWLRRRRPRANTTGDVGGAGHGAHRVHQVVCQEMDANWRESSGAVSRVWRRTVRASSAAECLNGVLRRHQWCHRTVNQGLLDLKRLSGNRRAFREGKRRRQSPYELLGLKLPSYPFWDLLWRSTTTEGTTWP